MVASESIGVTDVEGVGVAGTMGATSLWTDDGVVGVASKAGAGVGGWSKEGAGDSDTGGWDMG